LITSQLATACQVCDACDVHVACDARRMPYSQAHGMVHGTLHARLTALEEGHVANEEEKDAIAVEADRVGDAHVRHERPSRVQRVAQSRRRCGLG
jgi:hypothetical protein